MKLSLLEWCYRNDCDFILEQWDNKKNYPLTPYDVSHGSEKKVFWHCDKCGHNWVRNICNTTAKKRGCPQCARQERVNKMQKTRIAKTGSFAEVHPELLKEWDYSANTVLPEEVSPKSNQKVWWKCDICKESYCTRISLRVLGHGCSKCSRLKRIKTLVKKNGSLFEKKPELLEEYMLGKNSVAPEDITPSSNKKYWWKCKKCGYEWQAPASSRYKGHGCQACNGSIVSPTNNLAMLAPELAEEWHPTKNGSLKPEDVAPYSDKKVWWKCNRGHEWQASVSNRYQGRNCKQCSSELRTSFPEQCLIFYLSQKFNILSRNKINGWEVDILLPDYNIGIEYDGIAYHDRLKLEDRERKKNNALKKAGIDLVRIKESYKRNDVDGNVIYFLVNHKYSNLEGAVKKLLVLLNKKTGVVTEDISLNIERDRIEIYGHYVGYIKKNSFAEKFPNLLHFWNYEKNNGISPEMLTPYSNKRLWWHCPTCNGDWIESVINVAKGNRCPFCSGHRVLEGFNDLKALYPQVSSQWDYEKNNGLTPEMFTAGSNKLVHWICEKGHSWTNTISYQVKYPFCKECAGVKRKATPLKDDLWNKKYLLAKDYYRKNNNLLIPAKYVAKDGTRLGEWIRTQRAFFKNGMLDSGRKEKLDSIGMVWSIKR